MRKLMLSLSFLLLPFVITAQEFNAGIVQGLWYSEEVVFADTPTRIYVAIRNNTGSDLTGIVEFFEGERKIGRKNVQALDGRIIESWTDWNPSYGDHTLKATLVRTELAAVGEATQEVEVTSAIAEDTLFVDYDTDKDGTGNENDRDDDGDGASDEEEKQRGTDPLVKNTPTAEHTEEDDEDTESEEDEDANEEGSDARASGMPQGLERYLSNSPAENVLTSVTSVIRDAKEDIDTYRKEREQKKETAKQTEGQFQSGFGEVSRATSTETSAIKQLSLADFFDSVWNLAKTLFDWGYTFILAVLSFVLGRPMLVQLGALLLILFIIMKFASKFGRRPKMKKI